MVRLIVVGLAVAELTAMVALIGLIAMVPLAVAMVEL